MSNHVAHPANGHIALASLYEFVKTTFVGGALFLVPITVLVLLLAKVGELLRKLAQPLGTWLPVHTLSGVLVANVILSAILVVACFLAGLLARVSFARRVVGKAEAGVLWRIPGYGFVKGLTESLDKSPAAHTMVPVLIHFDDAAQLAFEVDRQADGRRVIFAPSAPDPRQGSVMVMDENRVEHLPMTYVRATAVLRALGRGIGSATGSLPS
jgi:uncharacterized membrane protein